MNGWKKNAIKKIIELKGRDSVARDVSWKLRKWFIRMLL